MPIAVLMELFGPMLMKAIPQIAKIFMPAPTTEVAARNQAAAQVVFDTIKTATESVSEQEAVQKIVSDKAVAAAATQAVVTQPAIMEILEVGGGVEKAREFDVKQQAAAQPFYKTSAVFYISVLLLPIVYWLVGSLIMGGTALALIGIGTNPPTWLVALLSIFGGPWEGETRSGGFNLIIGLILGGICGVYFGVSVTQGRTAPGGSESSTPNKST